MAVEDVTELVQMKVFGLLILEGVTEGNQVGTWKYYNKKGKMTTEEKYNAEGKVVKSKDFK